VQDGWGHCKREAGTDDDARTIVRLDVSGQQQIGNRYHRPGHALLLRYHR